jgi:hypothetical protein
MRSGSIAAIVSLVAAGCALLFGQSAISEARDLVGLYWLLTGAVTLRAAFGLSPSAARRRS